MKKLWKQHSYAIILFVLSIFTVFIIMNQLGDAESEKYLKITINDGDTLWQIAEDFSAEHKLSPIEFIKWVESNNGIAGERIFPGDELVIPVINNSVNTSQKELASSQ
ncbi:cell division suppressor protein YneA [Cytobacillus depressus]|nr:LysM peptidoglycan-binding domain-containing protein [Cytobacillus depressus]